MQDHLAALYLVVDQIPVGRVTTYGSVARLAGKPNGARWVGHTLAKLPNNSKLPWHRVINSQGKISLPGDLGAVQCERLMAEGVVVKDRRVNLSQFGWSLERS